MDILDILIPVLIWLALAVLWIGGAAWLDRRRARKAEVANWINITTFGDPTHTYIKGNSTADWTTWTAPSSVVPPTKSTPRPDIPLPHLPRPSLRTSSYVLGWRFYSHLYTGAWEGDWTHGYLQAECRPRRSGGYGYGHAAPNFDCNCGIYAYKTRRHGGYGPHAALVAMSGTIIEHDGGYRAENVQVIAVHHGSPLSPELDPWTPLGITRCRSPEKLERVFDYFTKNPDALYDEVERLTLERMYALSR